VADRTPHLGGLEPTPDLDQISAAIDTLPNPAKREAALKAMARIRADGPTMSRVPAPQPVGGSA
jgi:hypothetical protein